MGLLAAGALGAGGWYTSQRLGAAESRSHGSHSHPTQIESPAIRHPEVSGLRVVTRQEVSPPTAAYNFRLTDHSGSLVSLKDLAGKVVLLSFVYTNCPEACPLLTSHYLTIQEGRLADAVARGDLALVFITTDPEQDTPQWLHEYTVGRGGNWLFLTGELAALEKVWDRYEIYREARRGLQEIVVYHSYKSYIIDDRGMFRYRYEGVWQPEDVVPDLRSVLKRS